MLRYLLIYYKIYFIWTIQYPCIFPVSHTEEKIIIYLKPNLIWLYGIWWGYNVCCMVLVLHIWMESWSTYLSITFTVLKNNFVYQRAESLNTNISYQLFDYKIAFVYQKALIVNTNISPQLFDYTITFVNPQH